MKNRPEKTVMIAELKAQLSSYLRAARRGQSVVVYERTTPVARLVPYVEAPGTLTSRLPTRAWGSTDLPPPVGRGVDSLAALADERQSER